MKILKTALPSKIAVSSKTDIDELRNHVLGVGFAMIDEYKDVNFKNNCSISYDFSIMLATIKG